MGDAAEEQEKFKVREVELQAQATTVPSPPPDVDLRVGESKRGKIAQLAYGIAILPNPELRILTEQCMSEMSKRVERSDRRPTSTSDPMNGLT